MDKNKPERLLHERFMPLNAPFRLFRHHIEWRVPVHWHEFFEIALVMKGNGRHIFNGRSVPIRRGCLFLLTPADFHEIIPDEGNSLRLYNAIFIDRFIRPELLQWIFQDGGGLAIQLDEDAFCSLEQEFVRMRMESEQAARGSEWMIAGSLERVIIEMLRRRRQINAGTGGSRPPVLHSAVNKAVTFLACQFHEPLTLETIARHVGLSANYFSECFRKETGVPFQRYLQEMRLKYAHSLLLMTQLPVTEVCFASGFGNLSHFERVFKSKYGQTPGQLRKKAAP